MQELALLSLFIRANLGSISKTTLRELSTAAPPPAPNGAPSPSSPLRLQLKDN